MNSSAQGEPSTLYSSSLLCPALVTSSSSRTGRVTPTVTPTVTRAGRATTDGCAPALAVSNEPMIPTLTPAGGAVPKPRCPPPPPPPHCGRGGRTTPPPGGGGPPPPSPPPPPTPAHGGRDADKSAAAVHVAIRLPRADVRQPMCAPRAAVAGLPRQLNRAGLRPGMAKASAVRPRPRPDLSRRLRLRRAIDRRRPHHPAPGRRQRRAVEPAGHVSPASQCEDVEAGRRMGEGYPKTLSLDASGASRSITRSGSKLERKKSQCDLCEPLMVDAGGKTSNLARFEIQQGRSFARSGSRSFSRRGTR